MGKSIALEGFEIKESELSSINGYNKFIYSLNKTIGLQNKPIMIGAIGDSITRNQITMSDNGVWGVYYAWVGRNWLLRTAMKLQGRAWANIYAVEGYSGQRTDQIFDQMLQPTATINPTHITPTKVGVLACKPDIVIEFSGTNDNYFQENSKEAMVAGRRAIWQRLIDNGITPVALSLLPNSLTDVRNTRIPEWNQAVKEEADKMGVVFVDIYTNCANGTHFKDGWNWNNGVPDVIDGMHPGAEACEQISIDLANALDKIIGTRVSTPTVYANTAIYTKPYDATKKGEEYKLFDTGLFPTIWNPRYENGNQTTTKTVSHDETFSKYGNTFEIEITNTTSNDGYSDFISPPLSVVAGEKHGVFLKYALEAVNNTDDIQIGISYNTDYSNLITFATGGNGNNASSSANGASIGGDFYQEITIPDGCTSIRIFLTFSTKANKNDGAKIKLSNYGTVRLH